MRSETSSREQAGPSSVELGTNAQHGTATAPDRPLRIAFFLGTFPVISETFILRQIAGLLALGHDVEIFADTRGSTEGPQHSEVDHWKLLRRTTFMELPRECAPWELPVWPLGGKTWIPGDTTPLSNFGRAARAFPVFLRALSAAPRLALDAIRPGEYSFQASSLSVLYRLRRLIGISKRFDVLHAHFGPVGNSFRFARQLWRAPLIVSFHGYDFSTVPRTHGSDVYENLFQTADLFTVNSDFTRKRVESLACPTEKIRKLPVGLDPDDFPFRARSPGAGAPVRILSIGRLTPIKGHAFAIEAIATLHEQFPRVHYDIVGDGPLRSTLERLLQDCGMQNHVTLHGALAGSALREVMDAAHIFLLPSVSVEGDQEGQGLALQEAQAAGLPVVATDHGALPEGMLPGESGFLIPEGDVKALAERLGYLVQHPEIWPKLGRNGRQFAVARYDVRKLNEELVSLYRSTLKKFSGNRYA